MRGPVRTLLSLRDKKETMDFGNQRHYVVIQDFSFGVVWHMHQDKFNQAVTVGENTAVGFDIYHHGKSELRNDVDAGLAVIHDESNKAWNERCWIVCVYNADAQSVMETLGRIFQLEGVSEGLYQVGEVSLGFGGPMCYCASVLFGEWVVKHSHPGFQDGD